MSQNQQHIITQENIYTNTKQEDLSAMTTIDPIGLDIQGVCKL